MNLTKQQKLDILSKAIDEGANIDVHYHGCSKEVAERIIKEVGKFAEMETTHHERARHQWYKFTTKEFDVAAFYDKEEVKI